MMVEKALFLLAVLGLVSLPAASATVQQQQGERCAWYLSYMAWKCSELYQLTSYSGEQCVSRAEFDRVAAQLNTWQNLTVLILKRFLLENPGILRTSMPSSLCLWLLWVNLPFYSFTAWDCSEPVAPPSGPKPSAAGQNWQTPGRTCNFEKYLHGWYDPGFQMIFGVHLKQPLEVSISIKPMDLCLQLIMRNLTFLLPISNSFLCYHGAP